MLGEHFSDKTPGEIVGDNEAIEFSPKQPHVTMQHQLFWLVSAIIGRKKRHIMLSMSRSERVASTALWIGPDQPIVR